MKKASLVGLGVVLGSLVAFGCSGSSNSPYIGDGGTGGGGSSGGPFGNLGNGGSTSGGGGSSTSGGSTSGGSSSGSTSGGSTSGGSTSGGSSGSNLSACGLNDTGNAGCNQCLVTSCCNQFHACAAEPQCKPVLNCVGKCAQGDQACVNTCEQQYPNGVQPASNAVNCYSQSCGTACQ